ncbi:MAG: hypothetical protein P8J37_19885 [Fuerstiella sp.]|nr:hypothetical protein [Fuerstiella sp.]
MKTSKTAVGNVDGESVPGSRPAEPRKSARRRKPRTHSDSKSADHSTVADRILRRLDELDSRVQQLAAAASRTGEQAVSTESARLDVLAAEIADSTSALALQFSDTLNQQNQAIAGIASDLSGLHESLAGSFTEFATRSSDEKPPESQSENSAHTEPTANDDNSSPADETGVASDSAWDQIKVAFLMEQDEGRVDEVVVSSEASAPSQPECDIETVNADESVETDQPFEVPELVDIDSLSDAELRPALVAREALIATLIQRLLRKVRSTQTLSAEQLNEVKDGLPEELV